MDTEKQILLLEYLISSVDTFARCIPIVESKYFDPEIRNAIVFVKTYYAEYNTTPDSDQIKAETGIVLEHKEITNDKIEYCSNEIEKFCKRKAIEHAVLAAPELIINGDYGKVETMIRDAILVTLGRDLGMQYFDDPEERIRRILESEVPVASGWSNFDACLNGGILRKQMVLFSANSGGGKSIVMANLGLNMMESGHDVLYITLELSEEMVSQRYDSMITSISTAEWRHRTTETAAKILSKKDSHGSLTIKYLPSGTNSNEIKAYLKEYELQYGKVPDVIIVDYLDEMGTNENVRSDNVFEKDKAAAGELRNIAVEYNAFVITASQQNRGAVGNTDLNHSHIAGGISKINITDVYVSIIMTDSMRAQGEMAFMFLKTRSSDGVGKTVYMKWNNNTLRVTSGATETNASRGLTLKKAVFETDNDGPTGGDSLLGLLNDNLPT